jgi:membrane protein YdbS with pleckstrin-like domain
MRLRENKTDYTVIDEIRTVVETLMIVFIVMKTNGMIDWSWWVILSPLWVFGGLSVIFLLIIYILRKID